MNALTIGMMDEVGDAISRIEKDTSIRALILTGAGRGFCSGQNLKDRIPPGSDLTGVLMDSYFKAIDGIRNCRVPVVVAVNGTAAGGGFSVALCGDFLIAARSAKFIQVFSRIGLSPDLGSTYLLPRAIGRARALQLMMTNDPLDAATAAEWGLIAEVLDDDRLMPRAREIAERLATGPTYALQLTRRMVDEGRRTASPSSSAANWKQIPNCVTPPIHRKACRHSRTNVKPCSGGTDPRVTHHRNCQKKGMENGRTMVRRI